MIKLLLVLLQKRLKNVTIKLIGLSSTSYATGSNFN